MNIHIVNLKKESERRKSILSQAEKYNLNVKIFNAYTKEEALCPVGQHCIQKKIGVVPSEGSLIGKRDMAIYMSQVALYEELLKDSMADYFVIGEDDIEFRSDTKKWIVSALRLKNHWDVCYLHTSKLWCKKFGNDEYKYINKNFFKLDKPHWSNALYIISRSGIIKFLKRSYPMVDRVDVALYKNGLRQICLTPGIFDRCRFNQS